MICECGNHWFSCDKIMYQDVEISTISDAEYEGNISQVKYVGPFICTECGREYESLED